MHAYDAQACSAMFDRVRKESTTCHNSELSTFMVMLGKSFEC